MKKKYTLENMNGDTQNDEKTYSLNDMNCLNEDKKNRKRSGGWNETNCISKEEE